MQVNIYLHDEWHTNLTFDEALSTAAEYYAEHGDSLTIITEASTSKVVNQFQISNSNRWYTFEELIELSYYKPIEVIDARRV